MKKFFSIVLSELKNLFKDKGSFLIMVIGVTAYTFCYVIPYYNEVIKEVPIVIVDNDKTNLSRDFVKRLNASDTINIVDDVQNIDEAQTLFYKDKIKGFVIVPKDFEKDLKRGKQTNISVYGDTAYLIVYKTFFQGVAQTAIEYGGRIEVAKMMKKGVPKKKALALKSPFEFVQMPLFNPSGGYKTYVYPVIFLIIMHQTLIVAYGLIQGTRNEKKEICCKNKDEIPLILFARASAFVFYYLLWGTIGFLILPELFVYPMSYNLIPAFLMYILMMYGAAFFVQTISYWFRTRETVIMIMISSSLIFIFIPGLIWPRESMPLIINAISFFIPATCGVDSVIKINQNGASFFNVIYDYFWLIFLNVFYFITAVKLTKKIDKEFEENS